MRRRRGPTRVVIVAGDCETSESNILLLFLLRWFLERSDVYVDMFVWKGGELVEEFARLAYVRDLEHLDTWWVSRWCNRLRARRLGQMARSFRLRRMLEVAKKASVVYFADAGAARICGWLPDGAPPLICHVHGDEAFPERSIPAAHRAEAIDRIATYIASGDEAERDLVETHGVASDRIERHDFALDMDILDLEPLEPPSRLDLGIPEPAFVVVGTGTRDWWASPDQFVLMAWALCQAAPGIDPWFVWITPDFDDEKLWPLRHDVRNCGLDDRFVILEGPTAINAIGIGDVLVLSTREEVDGRLVLEALRRPMPVVRTDNGVEDLMGDSPVVVPYLDVTALCDAVVELALDPVARNAAATASAAALGRLHNAEASVPALALEILRAGEVPPRRL